MKPLNPHVINGPDCTCPSDDYHRRIYAEDPAPPRAHFHTWVVVEASRHSHHGDQVDMEACSECPNWILWVRAAPGRELVEAGAVADAVIEALDRLGAVSQ